MITGINESKILIKHISCQCKCKFDGRKHDSNQWLNNSKCWCECKKHIREKNYIWNPATCSCKNGKYLPSRSIIDDSLFTCDETIDAEAKLNDEETKTVPTNFDEENITCNIQNFYILLAFLLINITLLIFTFMW